MRKINAEELSLLGEHLEPIQDDIYLPEDFTEFCRLADHHHEVQSAKRRAVESILEQWDDLVRSGLLSEAGPVGYDDSGGDTVQPWDHPEISREKVLMDEIDINFLMQFPPKAHASLLFNTLYTTNPAYMRYLGPGLKGALSARKNGDQVGNWMEEVRWVDPSGGRPWNVFDPMTDARVPRLGAKTKRPVAPNKPNENPNWGIFGGSYEGVQKGRPKDPKETLRKIRSGEGGKPGTSKSKFKGVGPENGVYIPFAQVIDKLETPIGAPRKQSPAKRGQVGVNLEPPDPNDPESYLPHDPNTLLPLDPRTGKPTTDYKHVLPFGTQGYKPQALDTSKSGHGMVTQWMRGMEENPEMFRQKRLNVLSKKYGNTGDGGLGVPMEPTRMQWNQPNRDAQGNVIKRSWVPSPNDVTRNVLQRAQRYTPDDMQLMSRANQFLRVADQQEKLGNTRYADLLRRQAALFRREGESPGQIVKPAKYATARGGYKKVWDTDSKKIAGPGTDRPDEPEAYEKHKVDRSEPTPISMPVRRMKLDHIYRLVPVKDRPMSISPELYEEYKEKVETARSSGDEPQNIQWETGYDRGDDKVFKEHFDKYQFIVNAKDRTFRPTKGGHEGAEASPWYWAAMDSNKRVVFYYHPDKETYDMPIYSPGVIDMRKGNNPVTLGGFDAAPQGAFEARPPKSQDEFLGSVYGRYPEGHPEAGKPDPSGRLQEKQPDRRKWKGWIVPMMYSADEGIKMGFNELASRINQTGSNDAVIADMKANSDKIRTAALQYMWYNIRNSKAFNFDDASDVYVNQMYNKRIFRTLFAAIEQTDRWMKKNSALMREWGINRPMSQMTMTEMEDFINLLYNAHEGPMFQTKIPVNHVKNDLKNYVADTDRAGQPIPDEGRGGFKTLNVEPLTLYHLMEEAREWYWKFIAKDMVSKVWQAFYKRGEGRARTNMDSFGAEDDGGDTGALSMGGSMKRSNRGALERRARAGEVEELAMRVAQRSQETGDDFQRHTNLMSDFNAWKRELAQKAKKDLSKASKLASANPGNIDAVANKVAAEITKDDLDLFNKVQDWLLKKYRSEGLGEGEAERKMMSTIHDEFRREKDKLASAQKAGSGDKMHLADPTANTAGTAMGEQGVQKILKGILDKYGDDVEHDMLARTGDMLSKGDSRALQALELLPNHLGVDEDQIEAGVTYHALKNLLQNGKSLKKAEKDRILQSLDSLAEMGILWDFQSAARAILSGDAA